MIALSTMAIFFECINQNMLKVVVRGQRALVALKPFYRGTIVRTLNGPMVDQPTRTSIQIEGGHIEDTFGKYINHSCNASTMKIGNHLVAIKKIKPGEEITFNYMWSESNLAAPFVCDECGTEIQGENTTCGKL